MSWRKSGAGPEVQRRIGNSRLKLALKAGERLFINGAVLRPDRKVSLELTGRARFLLEQNLIDPEQATTPLAQLHVAVQGLLIAAAPNDCDRARCLEAVAELRRQHSAPEMVERLDAIRDRIADDSCYEALRLIRCLINAERLRAPV